MPVYYAPKDFAVRNVLAGLGLFEAMALTGRPGQEVVYSVAQTLYNRLGEEALSDRSGFGTYVTFFAYQKQK